MAEKKTTATPVEKLGFEAALAELEAIVRQLEAGGGDLESSIAAYERGVQLKEHCAARLKQVESRIEKITQTVGGALETAPFDGSAG